jgi:hypothetical protein
MLVLANSLYSVPDHEALNPQDYAFAFSLA